MKILYLLPPSEGKNSLGEPGKELLIFHFKKPLDIAMNATEKDLKCKGKRYEEGIQLNKNIENSEILPAIERYSGVMYNAIDYSGMSGDSKVYFEKNFGILSGMYGVVSPRDLIGNYKLPIETKGLYAYWGGKITDTLNEKKYDLIVDLLPGSYKKMIQWKDIQSKVLEIDFYVYKEKELKKMTHGVKKVKGKYINDICNIHPKKLEDFPGKLEKISENRFHLAVKEI